MRLRRFDMPPVFGGDVAGEVADIFGGDDRAGFQGHGGEDDVGVEFLGVGGGFAATAGVGPHSGGAEHGRGGDGLVEESVLISIEKNQRFVEPV